MFSPRHLLFIFFALIFFIQTFSAGAQALQGKALQDSLLQAAEKGKDDTLKAKGLYKLAMLYASNDSANAMKYANKCLQLSQQLKWQRGIGLAYFAKAVILNDVTDFSGGLQNAKKAYDVFKIADNKKNIGAALVAIGQSYEGSAYYTKAIESNFEALKIFENINDSFNISTCYNNIGVNYYYLLQYDKAIDNYKKALAIYYVNGDKYGIASGLDNIAIVYLDEGKYDSANVYDLKGIKIFEEINELPALGRIYGNRGNILMRLFDAKSAFQFYNKSLAINTKQNITDGIAADYQDFGTMYLELAKDSAKKFVIDASMKMSNDALLQKAKENLMKAIAPGKESGDFQQLMNLYNLLSETEERLGNFQSALIDHKNYSLYKDSIFNDENKKKMEAMETERITEVKDQQIQLLNQQKALETSEVKRQTLIRNIIIVSVSAVALLMFVAIFLYNKRRKAKFETQVMEVETKALRAQMNPHFIFNSLQSVNRFVLENDKENASAYLSKFANLMRLILEDSREQEVPLSQDLHALELYMQLEALRFKNRFSYNIEVDNSIDKENTLIPPLLLQPFVENAILHGISDKENGIIKITVRRENEMICCVIEDNGKGRENIIVAKDENKKHRSLAMTIITERLNIINQLKKVKASVNIFDLKNAENKSGGLRIELLLPLELVL